MQHTFIGLVAMYISVFMLSICRIFKEIGG